MNVVLSFAIVLSSAMCGVLILLSLILLTGRRTGGLLFFRWGRIGGSVYLARREVPREAR